MGKTRIIAETGAGQHGVATATACALFDLPCTVFMGATDVERQQPNVFRMKLLGAEVRAGDLRRRARLKDAMNEALRDWVANVEDTYYCIGTVAGPHPYPVMVRDFQSVIGEEAKAQMQEAEGRLPDALVAAIGGGSQCDGAVLPLPRRPLGARWSASRRPGTAWTPSEHAASPDRRAAPACCTATAPICCRMRDGQITEAHSISAGLDYPGIGPEHSWLHEIGRVEYVGATDDEALAAFQLCSEAEGIIPALEPAHALAHVIKLAPTMPRDQIILMNLCGRGDKDIFTVAAPSGSRDVSRIAADSPHSRPAGAARWSRISRPRTRIRATSLAILRGLPGAGADLIEIGMPFTDPMADGPSIQRAAQRALKAGATLAGVLAHGARLPRARTTPRRSS